MAIDPAQVAPPTQNSSTPVPTQVIAVDIADLARQVEDRIAPKFTKTATDVAQQFHDQSISAIKVVAQDVADNRKQIEDTVASVGASYAKRLTSPRIQAFLIIGTVVVVWLGALATWIAYLLGAPEAKGIVGWVIAAAGGSSAIMAVLHQVGLLGATATPTPPTSAGPVKATATAQA